MPWHPSLVRRNRAFDHLFEAAANETPTGCWIWPGWRRGQYGGLFVPGGRRQSALAHRWSYEQFVGAVPEGMKVCHRCDTPLCVNPDHLFLGTQADNVRDMVQKGRHRSPLTDPLAAMTCCKRGHAFTATNTIIKANGQRRCRTCANAIRRRSALARS